MSRLAVRRSYKAHNHKSVCVHCCFIVSQSRGLMHRAIYFVFETPIIRRRHCGK